ncbi:WD40-repeat-containing domain protein [Ephemerocybe angulata]|uniref:WD40-repeat-containing domain protein n=1 Tax=Ephemerocybe angulata TaxID=980116 RepID=A0A8H6I5K3_9AGAR|nr:WD40-repeat-containing domain protein [Tulosesus angulatus]
MNATRAVVEEEILPGGGVALLKASLQLATTSPATSAGNASAPVAPDATPIPTANFNQELGVAIIREFDSGKTMAPDLNLEEKLAAMTKERDDLAAKYELLLQEKGPGRTIPGPKDVSDDSTLGPKEASWTPQTRRQRLLDTIDSFSAQLLAMVTELDREAPEVSHECKSNRQEHEAASAAIKVAESQFAEALANVNAVVEEYTRLRQEKDIFEEQERSLTAELNGSLSASTQSPVRAVPGQKQRLAGDYQKGCEQVELAAVEIEKLKRIAQGKERELSEWLSPESGWFTKELENFRAVRSSISTSLDAMRDGLLGGWEGKLGDNAVFLDGLGGCTVRPEMVAHPKDWAPVIEPFFLSQASLALSKEMAKFYSAVLQRLKIQEESAQREWKKGAEAIFEQPVPSFKKSSLPQLIPPAEAPGQGDVLEDPLALSEEPGQGVSRDLPPSTLLTLQGHTGGVTSVVFSRDGTKVVSGSTDNTIRVWDASTGHVQLVLVGHIGSCTSVAISGDGSQVVSGSDDKTVRTWDARTGTAQRVMFGHTGEVKSVDFSWDGSRVCSGSDDKTVRVWDASTGAVQILEGHTGKLISVAFSRDGGRIVSGAWDMMIRVWGSSSKKYKLQRVLQGHSNGVWSVAFSGDGMRIVSGSSDQTGRVWDALTGSVLWSLTGHTSIVTSIAISPDGKKVVSGSYDKTARVWDALTGELQNVLQGHSNVVWSVAISPDGRRVDSGAFDNTIKIWDMSAPTYLSQ